MIKPRSVETAHRGVQRRLYRLILPITAYRGVLYTVGPATLYPTPPSCFPGTWPQIQYTTSSFSKKKKIFNTPHANYDLVTESCMYSISNYSPFLLPTSSPLPFSRINSLLHIPIKHIPPQELEPLQQPLKRAGSGGDILGLRRGRCPGSHPRPPRAAFSAALPALPMTAMRLANK